MRPTAGTICWNIQYQQQQSPILSHIGSTSIRVFLGQSWHTFEHTFELGPLWSQVLRVVYPTTFDNPPYVLGVTDVFQGVGFKQYDVG